MEALGSKETLRVIFQDEPLENVIECLGVAHSVCQYGIDRLDNDRVRISGDDARRIMLSEFFRLGLVDPRNILQSMARVEVTLQFFGRHPQETLDVIERMEQSNGQN